MTLNLDYYNKRHITLETKDGKLYPITYLFSGSVETNHLQCDIHVENHPELDQVYDITHPEGCGIAIYRYLKHIGMDTAPLNRKRVMASFYAGVGDAWSIHIEKQVNHFIEHSGE